MLPPVLGLIWTISGVTGSVATWIVLIAFANALGSWWGPMTFASANTGLQFMFVLGNIWGLDGTRTPKNFCIAQIAGATFLALIITSLCALLSWATTTSVLWPQMGMNLHVLRWKWWYIFPLVIWPVAVTTVQAILVATSDSVQLTTNGFHCSIDSPLWLKLIGFPGAPAVLAIPSSLFFAWAMHRIAKMYKAHKQLAQYVLGNHRYNSPNPKLSAMNPPSIDVRPIGTTHDLRRSMDALSSPRSENETFGLSMKELMKKDPQVDTILHPTATLPQSPTPINYHYHKKVHSQTAIRFNPPSNAMQPTHFSLRDVNIQIDSEVLYDEASVSDISSFKASMSPSASSSPKQKTYPPRTSSLRPPERPLSATSRAPPESLLAGIWRLLLFQGIYLGIVLLLSVSTLNNMVRNTPPPGFNSEDVCLLLGGWAAVIVFGHTPGVRKEIKMWISNRFTR